MKPNFALSLSFDSISLLQRAETGWSVLGDVNFQKDDLTPKISRLRKQALSLDPTAAQVKLVIPNEQIKYLTLARPKNALIDDIEALINAHLKNATPYQLSELRFDWATTQDNIFVAAVAIETLQEAEAFAQSFEFKPLGNVAIPPKDSFIGEAFFGTAEGDRRRMECDEQAIFILPNPELIPPPLLQQPIQSPATQNALVEKPDKRDEAPKPEQDFVFRSQRESTPPLEESISEPVSQTQALIAQQVILDPRYAASLMVSTPLGIGRTAAKSVLQRVKSAFMKTGFGLRSLRQVIINNIRSIDLSGAQLAAQQIKNELSRQINFVEQYREELVDQQGKLRRQFKAFWAKSRTDIKVWWQQTLKALELPEDLKRVIKPFWPTFLLTPVILAAVGIAAYSLYEPQTPAGKNELVGQDIDSNLTSKMQVETVGTQRIRSWEPAFAGEVKADISPKIAELDPILPATLKGLKNVPSKPETVINEWVGQDIVSNLTLNIQVETVGIQRIRSREPAFASEVKADISPKIAELDPILPATLEGLKNVPSKPETVITDDSFVLELVTLYEIPRVSFALGVDVLDQPVPGGGKMSPLLSWQTLALINSDYDFIPLERPGKTPLGPNRPDTLRNLYQTMPELPDAPAHPLATRWDFLGAIYNPARDPMVHWHDATALPDSANLRPDGNFLVPFLGLSVHDPTVDYDAASILRNIPVAPIPPADMVWGHLEDLYIATIDPPIEVYDAIALPDLSGLIPDSTFIRQLELSLSTPALNADDLRVVEELPKEANADAINDQLRPRAKTDSDAAILPQEIVALDTTKLAPEAQTRLDPSKRTPLSTEVDLLEDGSSPPNTQAVTTAKDGQVSRLEASIQNLPSIPDRPNMVPKPSMEEIPLLTLTGIPLVTVRPPQRPSSLKSPDQKAQEALAALALLRPKVRPAEAVAAIKPLPFEQPLLASLRPKSRPFDLETTQGINFLSRLLSTVSEGDEAEVGSGAGTEPSNALVRKQATLQRALDLRQINLIGVFGTKSTRRALIRLKSGRRVMVEVGDRLDGGRVAAIAKNELRYIKSGENITLSLPRG